MSGVNKSDEWNIRKAKAGTCYYLLMIIFVLIMFFIMAGIISTDKISFWWQG